MDPQLPDVHFEFENEALAPRKARQALSPLFPDPDDAIADAVTLSASELVSNVVTHTESGGRMLAWDPKPHVWLRLQVEDHDPAEPLINEDPGVVGRGLTIVDGLSDAWGVDRVDDGKIVWAEFSRESIDDETSVQRPVDEV